MRWPQRWSTVATEQGLAGAAQEIKVCTISSTLGEGGPGGARFDRDMPTAMVQLGMASYDWSELIGEANLCLRLPFTITGALLCCIPSLFVDDYDRAVNRRGRQVVASWQEEHRLPKGLCARFLSVQRPPTAAWSGRREVAVHQIEFFYVRVTQINLKVAKGASSSTPRWTSTTISKQRRSSVAPLRVSEATTTRRASMGPET